MTISITEIVNSTGELAAFPLTGDVAFSISGPIDHIKDRITVFQRDDTYPNGVAYLFAQYGSRAPVLEPAYNVTMDANNKVTVSFEKLAPSRPYSILFNATDMYGTLLSSQSVGTGSIEVKNYRIGLGQITALMVEIISDSVFDDTTNRWTTSVRLSYGSTDVTLDVYSNTYVDFEGLSIKTSPDLFLSGDNFLFSFNALSEKNIEEIQLTTTSAPNTAQILADQSRRANELDLIAFYEEENQPVSPEQPTSVKRILKSATSMIIEFTEPVNMNTLNVTFSSGPAFNMLSLPEADWLESVRVEVRALSPNVLYFKFLDSTTTSNEVVINV